MVDLPILSEEQYEGGLSVKSVDTTALTPRELDLATEKGRFLFGLYSPENISIRAYSVGAAAVLLAQTVQGMYGDEMRRNYWRYSTCHQPREVLELLQQVTPPDGTTWRSHYQELTEFLVQNDAKQMAPRQRLYANTVSGFGMHVATSSSKPEFVGASYEPPDANNQLHTVTMLFGREIPSVRDAAATILELTIHPDLKPFTPIIIAKELPDAA